MKQTFALKGNLVYTKKIGTMEILEHQYLVCADGRVQGIYPELPQQFCGIPVEDMGDRIIIPGLTDLHVHAPQYSFRGLGMDLELLDWLNSVTFPEESKYSDQEYARKAYSIFAEDLKKSETTRACIFGTLHVEATDILMELLEKTGLKTFVGKVNMDRNGPDTLQEKSAEISAADTIRWLDSCTGKYQNVKPILTPRFIPSCSDELMKKLAEIQKHYKLPVQSHLSENPGEVSWVQELCPESSFYGDAYRQFDLFGGKDCPTIMAHCVYCPEEEIQLMKEQGVYVAHCPQSNTNLSSGIAPVKLYLEQGIHTGLGTDIAGGHSLSMLRAVSDSIQVSKLHWRYIDSNRKPLTFEEAFYIGTMGGGEFFGKTGSFLEGYEFDAIILDDTYFPHPQPLTVRERLERLTYLSDARCVTGKYVSGTEIF